MIGTCDQSCWLAILSNDPGHALPFAVNQLDLIEVQSSDLLCARFHEIQPQAHLKMMPPAPSSRKIVSATPKCVPYPVLQENTLVLSNFLVVGKRNGKLSLMFRYLHHAGST